LKKEKDQYGYEDKGEDYGQEDFGYEASQESSS